MEFRSPAPQKGLGKDPEAAGLLRAEQEVVLACAYTVCPLHTKATVGGRRGTGLTHAAFGRSVPLHSLTAPAWPSLLGSSLQGTGSVSFLSHRWETYSTMGLPW